MTRLFTYLFGCRHARYSWPQGEREYCVVACLKCGARLKYDWGKMRVVR